MINIEIDGREVRLLLIKPGHVILKPLEWVGRRNLEEYGDIG